MIHDVMTPLEDARYRLVHDFKGGAARLGPLVGMNPGTLCNKVNPRVETHHLTVDEAIMLQNATRDYRLLAAEAMTLNHVCIQLADYDLLSDVELLNVYAGFHGHIGAAAQQLSRTLEDGVVTRGEAADFRRHMFDVFRAGIELCNRLEALTDG